MPDDSLKRGLDALQAVSALLRDETRKSPALRTALAALGEWLIDLSQRDAVGESSSPERAAARSSETAPEGRPTPPLPTLVTPAPPSITGPRLAHSEAIVPLKLGDSTIHVPVRGTTAEIGQARAAAAAPVESNAESAERWVRHDDIDLEMVERRCRLKARAGEVAIERRAAAHDPVREPKAIDQLAELIAAAKALPNCFLWQFWTQAPQPDDATFRITNACYLAHAAAARAARVVSESTDPRTAARLGEALQLLAEANSALRIALRATWLTSADGDQDEVHTWLKLQTSQRQVFVPRFMRLEDPADPAHAADVQARSDALLKQIESAAGERKKVDSLVNKLRYHAEQLRTHPGESDAHHRTRIAETVANLAGIGVAPTDARVTGALGADTARGFVETDFAEAPLGKTLRALHASAERAQEQDDEDDAAPRAWSARVGTARDLLAGKAAVLIGGTPRPHAAARIQEAFGFVRLDWVELVEHSSGDAMRAPIARPDVAVVLVLIRLTGHLHAEEANAAARAAGKPCVYLKAGYNPEQIAEAVLTQAEERLRAAGAEPAKPPAEPAPSASGRSPVRV
ncbi:hypothetical protein BH11PLA1_BH11PLA1_19930 [soil metagenome]